MATYVVISSMVGVGVLTTSGYTVASVGSNQLMLAPLDRWRDRRALRRFVRGRARGAAPQIRGGFVYLYEAYGPLMAFLSGWCRS